MNINLLRDTDDDPGFYVAVTSPDPKWPGAVLFQSRDGGASYGAMASLTQRAAIGTTVDGLADFGGGNIPDETNRVTVTMDYGTLASVSYSSFLEGAQAAIVGDEIVFFRQAVLNADGSYTVSGLLRGRRGSEYAMGLHTAGERFVLLDAATLHRVADVTASLGVARLYKAVTSGTSLSDTPAQAFTNVGAGLKPYAPVHLGGGRNAAGDLTLTWVRRGRLSGEWRDGVDVPLGEASEAYEVEIWDSGRTAVKRTLGGLTGTSTTYTAAQQIDDFGSVQAVVRFSVYQLSAVVGRGYEAQGMI